MCNGTRDMRRQKTENSLRPLDRDTTETLRNVTVNFGPHQLPLLPHAVAGDRRRAPVGCVSPHNIRIVVVLPAALAREIRRSFRLQW